VNLRRRLPDFDERLGAEDGEQRQAFSVLSAGLGGVDRDGQVRTGQGAEIIVAMAQVRSDGPTGGFFNADGVVPW
jgi:hypothetical protein